jgi:murein DD-endopeptidase MepM/ murein hydrolase activator NlpD
MRWITDTNFINKNSGFTNLQTGLNRVRMQQASLEAGRIAKPLATPINNTQPKFEILDTVTNSYGGSGQVVKNDALLKGLVSPLDRIQITSPFATRPIAGNGYNVSTSGKGQWNVGVDLNAGIGTPLKAMGDGKVTEVMQERDGNRKITVQLDNGLYTQFNHLSAFGVKVGDTVKAGQQIGKTGDTGGVTGPHLDAMIFTKDKNGKHSFIDSNSLFNQWKK